MKQGLKADFQPWGDHFKRHGWILNNAEVLRLNIRCGMLNELKIYWELLRGFFNNLIPFLSDFELDGNPKDKTKKGMRERTKALQVEVDKIAMALINNQPTQPSQEFYEELEDYHTTLFLLAQRHQLMIPSQQSRSDEDKIRGALHGG